MIAVRARGKSATDIVSQSASSGMLDAGSGEASFSGDKGLNPASLDIFETLEPELALFVPLVAYLSGDFDGKLGKWFNCFGTLEVPRGEVKPLTSLSESEVRVSDLPLSRLEPMCSKLFSKLGTRQLFS